ncbi:hypothetical protein INT45_010011 [Circinella minor]|uniref:Uncharacterized protein n=1 Tax=Circinella minor TaxID=1195481 RepID=A0A8H7S6C1_9FUNG|nr:hypothetical protein INT45_010011 [Circinella minor]
MKKFFVQIHDRFSSSSSSFDTLSRQPSTDKITLEQAQTTSSKSQEHRNQKWRKRFSISTTSSRKRLDEKNNNNDKRIFQSPSARYFDKKKEGRELTTIISNSSNNILSTTTLQQQQQQRDIDNNKLEMRQENNHYVDDNDDFYNYNDLGPARPFSCTAAVGPSIGEKKKRQEKGISIDEMSVSNIVKELRLGKNFDLTNKNGNNDDDDSFVSFRYEKDATANTSPFSDLDLPTPRSNNFIHNNHNISNNDALKSDNNKNQHNSNHDTSISIRSNTFQYNQYDRSQLTSIRRKDKNNKNLDETNNPVYKKAVLHLHAWKSAAFQTRRDQSIKGDSATKRDKNSQEEEHVLELDGPERVNGGGPQNEPTNFQHCHDSNNTNDIVKKFIHDDVTIVKNLNEANVHVNNCFSYELPTKKQSQLNEWNYYKQQQERFGANININNSSSSSSMNDKLQECDDSITSQSSKVCNIAKRNNSTVTDLSIGDDTTRNLLSQQCTVPAQTIVTKDCTLLNDNTNSISSYATNDRKSNRTIDVASESQGKQGTKHDAATIVKIQVEKTIMEMTLTRKINDVLNANASLNERIKSMEEILANQSSTSTTIAATDTMILSMTKEKNKLVGGRQQQDKILRTHALAQLGLIEYLEGESDLASALERFKKQLETELSDSK